MCRGRRIEFNVTTLVGIHLFQRDFRLTLFSAPTLVVCLSVQTLPFERRKLGLQAVTPHLDLGAARDYREGSDSCAVVRRRNHVGTHRSYFDHCMATWPVRISRIYWFIPRSARYRPGPSRFALRVREKGLRLTGVSSWLGSAGDRRRRRVAQKSQSRTRH
jgi:hypothetical protein